MLIFHVPEQVNAACNGLSAEPIALKLCLLVLTLWLAIGCSVDSSGNTSPVDAQTIMKHAEKMVSFGPHPPGSDAQKKVGDYISAQLKSYGIEVRYQEFEPVTPIGRLPMRNIWGVLPGKQDKTIILASHYDSKYFTDFPFVGANDGGSSSAVLLELARQLATHNSTDCTLWFVFFDGEEAIQEWTDLDSLYGSREFARMLESQQSLPRVHALILLDLVGEKDLHFRRETQSSPWLVDLIWSTAKTLGYSDLFGEGAISTSDDHIPFVQLGVQAIDIIDLEYQYWHTREDTIDKLSAENMKKVAQVVLAALPEIAKHPGKN